MSDPRAKVIDDYLAERNYFPHLRYRPIGQMLLDEVKAMGPNGLYASTAAALVEKESGGKNIFGCDSGSILCHRYVTRWRVWRLLRHVDRGGASNGVGLSQLTYPPFIREAQKLGGAHKMPLQMRVGFRVLNDLIARHGWPAAAGAYNTGQPVVNAYAEDLARLERVWADRLRAPADRVVLRSGLGKDGSGPYVRDHPTNYIWRPDVDALVHRIANMPEFRRKIWICTYKDHPPGHQWWARRDTTSFDVWSWGGRGDPLPRDLGQRVFDTLFNMPGEPLIWWTIWNNRMWSRYGGGWQAAPGGPAGSDAPHLYHIHCTYLDQA